MENNNGQQPSLMIGHVQYVKGAVESTIGAATGSQAWKTSGEQDKAAAQAAMKKAGEQRDPNNGYGKIEEMAGNLTGCEGMQREGAASKKE